MNRREFLQRVGILTGGTAAVAGLSALEAHAAGPFDVLFESHRTATLDALFDTLLPPSSGKPGGKAVLATKLVRSDKFVKTAVNIGYFPRIAERFAGPLGFLLEKYVVTTLDNHPLTQVGQWWIFPKRIAFKDCSAVKRYVIVGNLLAQRKIIPSGFFDESGIRRRFEGEAIELMRSMALYAYAGGTLSEAGLRDGLGWPPYENYDRGRHNAGYPVVDDPVTGKKGFSYNKVPQVGGVTPVAWADSLGNPL